MNVRRSLLFWTITWLTLVHSLFTFTFGWRLNPYYARHRLLRRKFAPEVDASVGAGGRRAAAQRPLFGRRITRSLQPQEEGPGLEKEVEALLNLQQREQQQEEQGAAEQDLQSLQEVDQIEDWKRQLQDTIVRKTKRRHATLLLVFFECGPGQAVCRHGGQGPAITYRWQNVPICTCLCPANYTAPRCESWDSPVERGPEYRTLRLRAPAGVAPPPAAETSDRAPWSPDLRAEQ